MRAEVLAAAGAAAAAVLAAHGAFHPRSPVFGRAVARGPRGERRIFLTFDDGPDPETTPRVLDVLAAEGVPATFFLLGERVRRRPELARRAATDGHDVGSHTFEHRRLALRGPGATRRTIERARDAIVEATGLVPLLLRTPHGWRNPFVAREARRAGCAVVGWTFGVWDTDRPGAAEIRRRVRDRLSPGAIVLLHDGDGSGRGSGRGQTAEALPGIIADARSRGFSFGRVSELVAGGGRPAGRAEARGGPGAPP